MKVFVIFDLNHLFALNLAYVILYFKIWDFCIFQIFKNCWVWYSLFLMLIWGVNPFLTCCNKNIGIYILSLI